MLITERYKDGIFGCLSYYDRILIHGNLMGWCYADGMTSFLNLRHIKIFSFPNFAKPMNYVIRENAARVAKKTVSK